MASGSTINFCSRINQNLDPSGNNLALYCKENGNMLLLDPSGAIPMDSVDQEDLLIYATLTARVRNKSLVIDNEEESLTTINFIKGKDTSPGQAPVGTSFLTTNWTDIGSIDSKLGEDLETFGMTNIDINFNSGFVPIITIDFVDIRGATLFEQGSCSPYGAFFHQPYPIFELTVKGYYGQPVKYFLHVNKFNTSFDPGTGNYKSRAEFIGYSYAFLSDIILGYIMAAPYMEDYDSETKLISIYDSYLKYYKELGYNNGINKFNPVTNLDGRPFTIFNYVKKVEDLMGQGNSDDGPISEIQNSTELADIDDLDNIEGIISDIESSIKDFKEDWGEAGGSENQNLYTYGTSNTETTSPTSQEVLAVYNAYFSSTGQVGIKVETYNEILKELNLSSNLTPLENADFTITNDDNNLYQLNLKTFIGKLESKVGEITSVLNKKRDEFKILANEKIKGAIGFVPTIRSFFTVLLANTELFLELLKDASHDAEVYHQNSGETFRHKGVKQKVGGKDGVVWAWPTYVELKKVGGLDVETDVEAYPGNNPKFSNWPEVKFVESFLKALQEMQKDISQEDDSEEVDLTIDPFDDIPGRDNYIPINAMESPAGARDCNNNYYNLNGTDKFYKTLGERFIILSNFSSVNSNNLNTSILATARNNFFKWSKEDSSIGKKLTTSIGGTEGEGISNGIEFLNNGTLTPYFSSGIPFNPPKFGGLDSGGYTSVTYGEKYREASNILGYPYTDWSVKGHRPYGIAGSEGAYNIRKGTNIYNPNILNDIDSGGEIVSFDETTNETIAQSLDLRKVYYDISVQSSAFPDGQILNNSPVSSKITDEGNPNVFIISEPIYYTKTVILMWAGLESITSRDEQYNQIPKEIKDRCFIVLAAGTKVDKQNTYDEVLNAFTTYYAGLGLGLSLKSSVTTGTQSVNGLDTSEFVNFDKVIVGYAKGAIPLFTTSDTNMLSSKISGLIAPTIDSNITNTQLTSVQRWGNNSRIMFGDNSSNQDKLQTLSNTIKNNGGKSNTIPSLNQSEAISKWFELYNADVLDGITDTQDTITRTPPVVTTPTTGNDTDTTSDLTSPTDQQSDWSYNSSDDLVGYSVTISEPQQKNWEFLGSIEAHNFYNSVTNVPLIGQIINDTNKTDEFYDKIIESLGIPEEDIYKDFYMESYRYNKPLILNSIAKQNGGQVNILPDIHSMSGDDLVRLRRFDNVITKGFEEKPAAGTPINVMNLWYSNDSGRKGFGIKKESTFIKAIDLNNYIEGNYGNTILGERLIGGPYIEKNKNRNAEKRLMKIPGTQDVKANRLANDYYRTGNTSRAEEGTFSDTGLIFTSYGPIAGSEAYYIDNSTDQMLYPRVSKDSNVSTTVMDKILTVDIFPDFEWYYPQWKSLYGIKTYGGDYNFKYARSVYEYNNPNVPRLKRDGGGYLNWHALDIVSVKDLNFYNKDGFLIDFVENQDQNNRKGTRYLWQNDGVDDLGPRTPVLSYANAYVDEVKNPKKHALAFSNLGSTGISDEEFQRLKKEIYKVVSSVNTKNTQTQHMYNNYGDETVISNDIYLTQEILDAGKSDEELEAERKAREAKKKKEDEAKARALEEQKTASAKIKEINLASFFGEGVETIKEGYEVNENKNANWLNVGGTLTETPFWRHNFPSTENDSNTDKSYYSFYGGGFVNSSDSVNKPYINAGVSLKPLYMGLQNDLDSYNLTSKFFPNGGGVSNFYNGKGTSDYYNGDNLSSIPSGVKVMLTNHNEDDISVTTKAVEMTSRKVFTVESTATNYNRTKAWKGALAYLFLSNQYHKPWTGQQSNSLRSQGPQGTLSLASMNTAMPRHSVLMLGAVLWRMRESGLLESNDDKWNMVPQITGGLDPVCYPKLPKTMSFNVKKWDNVNFIYNESNSSGTEVPLDSTEYPSNHGLRPPQLSIMTKYNSLNVDNGGDFSTLCFPLPDEWPTPAPGLIYAYDFFGDKGVTNPFKNQYKIWTPFFAKRNVLGLRYAAQNILWTSSEAQSKNFIDAVQKEFDKQVSDLDEYSESAKASINNELGEYSQNYLESSINDASEKLKNSFTVNSYLGKGEDGKYTNETVAGSDEAFTRFAPIAHNIGDSFTVLNNETKYRYWNVTSYETQFESQLINRNIYKEDGRSTSFETFLNFISTSGVGGSNTTNTTNILSSEGVLYNGTQSLSNEFLQNNGEEITIKTWAEFKKLVEDNEYVKPDGSVLKINKILAEIPFPEEETTYSICYPGDRLYDATNADGSKNVGYNGASPLSLSQGALDLQNEITFAQNNPNSLYGPNVPQSVCKTFKAIIGQISVVDLSEPSEFTGSNIDFFPQINELAVEGITIPTGFANNKYDSSYEESRYFVPEGQEDVPSSTAYKSKESTKRYYEILKARGTMYTSSVTDDDLNTNVYRFTGVYNRFNGSSDIVYSAVEIKQGRKFVVLPLSAKDTTDDANESVTSVEENEDIAKIKENFKHVGYLRGYLPIGPELWFMPTSVKEIFINEFEEFVGDFNNFTDSGDFDKILKIVDPLNFPKSPPTNKFTNVMDQELTYPTIFEEIGTYVNGAPYLLRVSSDETKTAYANDVDLDDSGYAKVPQPLIEWIQYYSYGSGVKPYKSNATKLNNTLFREQKAPYVVAGKPITEEEKIKREKNEKEGIENKPPENVNTKNSDIWDILFGSYYIVSSSTPRIWSGEFPLKLSGPEGLVETTNDYFRFSKQELFSFLKGFLGEINKSVIKEDYKTRLKNEYLGEINAEALGASQDDDIRLSIYRSLKSIYDKWISASPAGKNKKENKLFYNPIGKDRILMDHFSFVNRVNEDIGDKALVNIDTINELFLNTTNSIYGVTSDILDSSNFNFFPLPSYVDLSAGVSLFTKTNVKPNNRQQAVEDMFRPISTQERFSNLIENNGGPHFLCQYVGGYSKELELSKNKEKGCLDEQTKKLGRLENKGDSYGLSNIEELPPDFAQEKESSNGVIGFKVKFGSDTQSHFKGVSLEQAQYKNTQEALVAMDKIANAATDGGSGGFIAKGQSLYEVFLNRSYSCTVEALGNPMIQPLQYFELENVPMFYGSYLIRDVKHTINPHNMTTTFTGDRIPYAVVPIVEDIVSTFKVKPIQNGDKKSLKSGGSSTSKKYGSVSKGTPGKPVDLSIIKPSTETKVILNTLTTNKFELVPYKYKVGNKEVWLNTEYPKQGYSFTKGGREPEGIVLHWSAGHNYVGAHSTLRTRECNNCNLSYHIEVGEDGVAYQFSDLNRSAAHAGCPASKGPRCKGLNSKTIAISYVGGVESGAAADWTDKKTGKTTRSGVSYARTWEQWQSEELTTPFCKNGTVRGTSGLYVCSDNGKYGVNGDKPITTGKVYRPKDQWESIINSILFAKTKWPSIKYITSHHWNDGGKTDVGQDFPWGRMLNRLKDAGWSKDKAGADPYIITEWIGKDGKIIKDNKLVLDDSNADLVLEAAEIIEYTETNNPNTVPEETEEKSYREKKGCKLVNIPQTSKKFTSAQIDAKIKEVEPSYNKAIRAGIIGNMFQESSFNINAYGTDGAVCGSYGLVQWRSSKPGKDRQDKFAEYCKEKNLKTDSLEGQIKWLVEGELQGSEKNRTKELLAVPDSAEGAKQAALWFAKRVERCGGCMEATLAKPGDKIIKRQIFAKNIFNGKDITTGS